MLQSMWLNRKSFTANCNANPGFVPEASGGDGSSVQFWFVGYDPSLKEIVVSHQGTEALKL